MIAFLSENLATILVGLAVAALFFFAVRRMIRQHKEGGCPGGCGGSCGSCNGCPHHAADK